MTEMELDNIFEPRNLLEQFNAEITELPEGWTLDNNGNPHYVYYINGIECVMWEFVNGVFFPWKYGNRFYRVSPEYYVYDLDNNYIGIVDNYGDLRRNDPMEF